MAGYGTDEGFNTWLTENGYELPDDAPAPAVLRQRGSTFIDALYGSRFTGQPTQGALQERAWPRVCAYAYGAPIASDVIPDAVVRASYHAALVETSSTGGSLSISIPGSIKRDKVGDVETEYADATGAFVGGDDVPVSILDGLLAPLLLLNTNILIRSVGA